MCCGGFFVCFLKKMKVPFWDGWLVDQNPTVSTATTNQGLRKDGILAEDELNYEHTTPCPDSRSISGFILRYHVCALPASHTVNQLFMRGSYFKGFITRFAFILRDLLELEEWHSRLLFISLLARPLPLFHCSFLVYEFMALSKTLILLFEYTCGCFWSHFNWPCFRLP